jgi:hypothetical protein
VLLQVLDKKPQKSEPITEENFESKFQVTNGNYINFKTNVDTIYKSSGVLATASTVKGGTNFYEIVNRKAEDTNSASSPVREDDKLSFWIDNKDLVCNCPKLRLRRKYLVMIKSSNLLKYLPPKKEEDNASNDGAADEDNASYETEDEDSGSSTAVIDDTTTSVVSVSSTTVGGLVKRAAEETRVELSGERVAGLLVDRETVIVEWRPEYSRRMKRFVKLLKNGRCL